MPETNPPNRCRLVLIWPQQDAPDAAARLSAALSGGDVASLILPQYDLSDDDFQALCEALVPLAQQAGVAAVIAGDTRIAARVKADGVHVEGGGAPALADVIDRLSSMMMVGAGSVKTRDDALNLGECQPDYLFFGRFAYDTKPEPHQRNLGLAEWWSEMVSIPCVVLGGSDTASAATVAATGAEFVALSQAVFGEGRDPQAEVARANALLDGDAPHFEAA
jgi:thiamine-phosphate pyrophosphorylase